MAAQGGLHAAAKIAGKRSPGCVVTLAGVVKLLRSSEILGIRPTCKRGLYRAGKQQQQQRRRRRRLNGRPSDADVAVLPSTPPSHPAADCSLTIPTGRTTFLYNASTARTDLLLRSSIIVARSARSRRRATVRS